MESELSLRLADELLEIKHGFSVYTFLVNFEHLSQTEVCQMFKEMTNVNISRWTVKKWRQRYEL